MNAITRDPIRTTDADGTPIVRVPLAKGRGSAVLYAEDFDEVIAAGFGRHWCLNSNGHGMAYVRVGGHKAIGNLATVARIVARAGARQRVRYHDGNPCNLRRDNLTLDRHGRALDREAVALLSVERPQAA